jgi:ATP-dependent exoDNAse (exonuclease V) alpha subunit
MFVNGTTGIIRNIHTSENKAEEYITIEIIPTGEHIKLKRSTNEVSVYDEKDGKLIKKRLGYWSQFGIMLGFSCSIHKSQGLSLSKINIDPRAFNHGMLYVALSRCTSVEGIHLEDFIREDALIMDKEVANFYKNLEKNIYKHKDAPA